MTSFILWLLKLPCIKKVNPKLSIYPFPEAEGICESFGGTSHDPDSSFICLSKLLFLSLFYDSYILKRYFFLRLSAAFLMPVKSRMSSIETCLFILAQLAICLSKGFFR